MITSNEYEKHKNDFFYAHSSALLSWQTVEQKLFFIFSDLVNAQSQDVSSAIFHSIVSLQTRLQIISAASAIVLKDNPLLAEWKKLKKEVEKASNFRNKLAHFELSFESSENDNAYLLIRPSIFDVTATENQLFQIKDIIEWKHFFEILSAQLNVFSEKVSNI